MNVVCASRRPACRGAVLCAPVRVLWLGGGQAGGAHGRRRGNERRERELGSRKRVWGVGPSSPAGEQALEGVSRRRGGVNLDVRVNMRYAARSSGTCTHVCTLDGTEADDFHRWLSRGPFGTRRNARSCRLCGGFNDRGERTATRRVRAGGSDGGNHRVRGRKGCRLLYGRGRRLEGRNEEVYDLKRGRGRFRGDGCGGGGIGGVGLVYAHADQNRPLNLGEAVDSRNRWLPRGERTSSPFADRSGGE